MKTAQKILIMGGVLFLTLSIIAGVLLFTVPAPTKNINTVHAATEEIDGQEYAVLDVYADTENYTITDFMYNHYYTKIVLQEDWFADNLAGALYWGGERGGMGHWIIFDLNGHTLTVGSAAYNFGILAERLEIRDTSPDGSGRVKGRLYMYNRAGGSLYAYIYGGTFDSISLNLNSIEEGQVIECEIHDSVVTEIVDLQNHKADYSQITKLRIYDSEVADVSVYITDAIATGTINDLVYETYYLSADDAANLAIINSRVWGDQGNYRYIMRADFGLLLTRSLLFYGNSVIFDLNGYTYYSRFGTTTTTDGKLLAYSRTFELTDSSPAGTGTLVINYAGNVLLGTMNESNRTIRNETLIISGGTCDGGLLLCYNSKVIFKGGNYNCGFNSKSGVVSFNEADDDAPRSVDIAPWLTATYNDYGLLVAVSEYDGYAVSTSPVVSGAYNHEIGLAWEINRHNLGNLVTPPDKIYYVFGRKQSDEFNYLPNCYFQDGTLNAAYQTWIWFKVS